MPDPYRPALMWPETPIAGTDLILCDFWRWAYCDLRSIGPTSEPALIHMPAANQSTPHTRLAVTALCPSPQNHFGSV